MSQKHLLSFTAFCICLLAIFFIKSSNDLSLETKDSLKELLFLGKNAYEVPVWKELLEQEVINFQELDAAFHAYYDEENHELSHQQHEAWEKIERAAKSQLDGNGNFYSKDKQYQDLLEYRQATQQKEEVFVQAAFNDPTTYTMQIPNAGNAGRWKNIGPFGDPEVKWSATGNGALQYVEFHPTDPAIMYVCARNRGLWRTTNYGKNWVPLTDHFSTPHTESVEINKSNPDIMYLGGVDKIWRSTDAAHSWTEVFNISSANRVHELHSDPNDANRVIATTEGGLYVTTDGGQNWTKKLDGEYVQLDISEDWNLMTVGNDVEDIDAIVNFSLDKGDTWKIDTITKAFDKVDKFYFAITESTPKQVFAYGIKNSNTPTRFIGLWKADFNTAATHDTAYFNFTKITHPTYNYPNGHNNLRVADNEDGFTEDADGYGTINPFGGSTWVSDFWVNKTNPTQMITLCNKMWGTDDGGILWEYKPSYGGSNWADNRFITTNVANDTIYWCNDGGIWSIAIIDMFPTEALVTAAGLSRGDYMRSKVVPKNGDICVIEGSEMDVSQMNKDVIMTGGQDIGQIFTRNGKDAHIASADVYRGRMKPNNDSLFHTGGLYVKIDGGSDDYQVYNNINADYHNPDRMYGFTRKNTTQDINTTILVRSPAGLDAWPVNGFRGEGRSNAGGHGWTPVNNQWETFTTSAGISQIKAGTFEQSRANAEIAFLGDENGSKLFITNNLSASQPTWTQLPNAPSASRYRIATHQFNENIVAVATDAGVYISKDKGQTWTKRGNIPAGSPSIVLLDKNRTEGIYVMTSMTVYYIDESLTEWIEFNQGQPLHQNQDMRIAYYADGDNRLYVGKYGSGVWGSPLYSVLEENNDMPVVDFRIHGNSTDVIYTGESVQLIELSMNYTSLAWTVENGSEVHNVGDEKYPTFILTTPGFYKVTLTATNDNGAISEIKEYYIEVLDTPTALACVPANDGNLAWFERMKKFDVNGDNFNVPGTEYYYSSDKIFSIPMGQSATFYGIDNYQTGWNQYWKVWIDYNNDGNFEDENEAIASSDGQVEEFTRNFTPPANAVTNTPLRMRVAGVRENTEPPTCNVTSGGRQTIDLFIKIKTSPIITNNHAIQSVNSATITSDYTNGVNVLESGILYSTFDGNLNFHNATKIAKTGALTAAENFDTPLTNLEYNVTYYYQTYVLDDSGLNYSEKKSFTLTPYKIPSAESIHATNLGGTQWELKGFAFPEGNSVTSITMEHGENDFSNSTAIDLTNLDANNTFNISNLVDINAATTYQFRIKVVDNGKTFYSNIYKFVPNQTYCMPSIDGYLWYKRYIGMSYGSFVHENVNATVYEDVTNQKVGEFEMGNSYTLIMKGRREDSHWNNLSYIAYIDFNNDQDFDDYNEIVGSVAANGLQLSDLTITIPTQDVITLKDLRMRIVGHEGGTVTGCSSPRGNYKDFTVSIKLGDCIGTGHIISYYADADNDSFGDPDKVLLKNCAASVPTGYVTNKQDCNDNNAAANPNSLIACVDDFPGMALDVRGNNGSVSIPNNALFQFGTTTDFSIALWMRTTNWVNDASLISTKDWDSGRNKGWNIALATDGQGIDVNVGDGTNRADLEAGDIGDSEWHHLAATFDRDGNVSLYIDGNLAQNTGMSNVGDISNALNLTIGADSENDYHFDGLIDEVSIWNKVLSQAEIREQKHITLSGNTANLVAYYQFNKSSTPEYINSLEGSLINSATIATATEPVGGGFANTQTESNGSVTFTSTDFSSNFTNQNGATVVASKINLAPNTKPATLLGAFDKQYWVIDRYGTGAFSGTITFKFKENLTATHENNPADVQLFGRAINSDAAWQLVTTATSVDATNNMATFNAITEFTQFLIGTNTNTCTFYADTDGDGYGNPSQPLTQVGCAEVPAGYVADNTDFDDTDRTRYPGAMEICDNIDNDGNGQVDEGAEYDAVTMTFDNETIPTETYTASQTISTEQIVTIANSTDVHLVAGQSITLSPGFSVATDGKFRAEIVDDCTGAAFDTEIAATARTTVAAPTIATALNLSIAPNPFKGQTSIAFNLPKAAKVSLLIYGMNGQVVENIFSEKSHAAGLTTVVFSPQQEMNGFYYFVLKTENDLQTKKVIVLGE